MNNNIKSSEDIVFNSDYQRRIMKIKSEGKNIAQNAKKRKLSLAGVFIAVPCAAMSIALAFPVVASVAFIGALAGATLSFKHFDNEIFRSQNLIQFLSMELAEISAEMSTQTPWQNEQDPSLENQGPELNNSTENLESKKSPVSEETNCAFDSKFGEIIDEYEMEEAVSPERQRSHSLYPNRR